MKLLQRYILRENIKPFLFSLFAFLFIFLIDKIGDFIDLFLNKNVSLLVIGRLLMYYLPSFMAISVPMAVLVSTIFAFSRLSIDNEIIALKALGINLRSILLPVLLLGIFWAGVMVWFNNDVLPRANLAAKSLFYKMAEKNTDIIIKPRVYITDFPGIRLYINEYNKKTGLMKNIYLINKQKYRKPQIILAKTGHLIKNSETQDMSLELNNGTIQENDNDKKALTILRYKKYVINIQFDRLKSRIISKGFREMNFSEMLAAIKKFKLSGRSYQRLLIEFHKKIAIPFASMVFIFIGMPLGIFNKRAGKSLAFAQSIFLIFLYYIILMSSQGFGEKGAIPPWLSMWLPNIFFAIIGSIMTYNTLKR